MPIYATKTNVKVDFVVEDDNGTFTSICPVELQTELTSVHFEQIFEELVRRKKEIETDRDFSVKEPEVSFDLDYLVVNENSTVTSYHSVSISKKFSREDFVEALNYLSNAKDNLELNADEVQMLVRTGNIIPMGNLQAKSLGVQGQYQFPLTCSSTNGQVIAYQGTSQLEWITPACTGGYQGYQGFQGLACGNQGAQGYQGKSRVGGLFLPYKFDTSTSNYPAGGYLRFNSAVLSSVTSISYSDTDSDGVSQTATLVSNMPKPGSLVGVYSTDNYLTKYVIFEITNHGLQSGSTPMFHTVAYRSSYGSLFSLNENVQVAFALRGYQGYQGSTGIQGTGSQGSQGALGYTGRTGSRGLQGSGGYAGRKGAQGYQGTEVFC